jgi:hypothetical protein
MSHLAASDVARNVCQALDMLRRPGVDFARDFLLAAGHDPQGDLAMLSNPVALAYASTAEITRSQTPPHDSVHGVNQGDVADPADESDVPGRPLALPGDVRVVYTMVPSICVGALTCGVCVKSVSRPFTPPCPLRSSCQIFTRGRVTCAMGRFLRDEATGETLMTVRSERLDNLSSSSHRSATDCVSCPPSEHPADGRAGAAVGGRRPDLFKAR